MEEHLTISTIRKTHNQGVEKRFDLFREEWKVEVKGRQVMVEVVFFSSFKTTFSLYLKLYRQTLHNFSMEITLNDIFN